MAFNEKISVIIDVVTDGARSSMASFKTSISEAEGPINKVKAAGSSMLDGLKANAGPIALAAGGALVAFGVKAVGAFTDTAKAAIDMGAATGLAVEDSSKWIAVGDDMGVTAEQLTAGIGKIAKSLDDSKWGEYGIQTRTAAGEARSANDVLIDTLDMLGKVTNETERARIGNDLFGKGYKSLAPIVGKTADEYKEMLGAVEDGQVITAEEAKKAERMRLAQDALADALQEVTLAVGEMVAEMAPAIQQLAEMAGWMTKIGDIRLPGMPEGFNLMTGQITYAREAWQKLNADLMNRHPIDFGPELVALVEQQAAVRDLAAQYALMEEGVRVAGRTQELSAAQVRHLADEYSKMEDGVRDLIPGVNDLEYATERAAESEREMARAAGEAKAAHDAFTTSLSNEEALINVQRLLDEFPGKLAEIDKAEKQGAVTAAEAQRQRREAILATKEQVFNYLTEVQKIPPERATAIVAELDWGSVANVESEIDFLARTRDAFINVHSVYSGGAGQGGGPLRQMSTGGYTGRGGKNEVAGVVHKGEYVIPAEDVDQSSGMPKTAGDVSAAGGLGTQPIVNLNIGVHPPVGSNSQDIMNAIATEVRRNGPGRIKQLLGI